MRKMDCIFIKDLEITCILGVYEHERLQPRRALVSIHLFTDTRPASRSDDFTDCVDYDSLAQEVRALAVTARRFTVEALAGDIARLCLEKSAVRQVEVEVGKPGAVPGAGLVGVKIRRKK
ncbi:MAG: dihydroneopterin aldolase [Chloroflexi bacterium]|nr:dihydroneopterin aldolase [Chloroflexota bacterium]